MQLFALSIFPHSLHVGGDGGLLMVKIFFKSCCSYNTDIEDNSFITPLLNTVNSQVIFKV
jgi:hypothetical protein